MIESNENFEAAGSIMMAAEEVFNEVMAATETAGSNSDTEEMIESDKYVKAAGPRMKTGSITNTNVKFESTYFEASGPMKKAGRCLR